jgi:YidC/Oxa1 family membrane protein insertase
MMKYMMVFMAVMFYKVPSGLGIYFITSSLWQICERLLLPKPGTVPAKSVDDSDSGSGGNGKHEPKKPNPIKAANRPRGWFDDLRDRVEQIMEEAQHDKTLRNPNGSPSKDDGRDRNRPRPRPERRK